VLGRQHAAPGLAEQVIAIFDAERLEEVVKLGQKEIDRPKVCAAVR
jgi:hypothetical protein